MKQHCTPAFHGLLEGRRADLRAAGTVMYLLGCRRLTCRDCSPSAPLLARQVYPITDALPSAPVVQDKWWSSSWPLKHMGHCVLSNKLWSHQCMSCGHFKYGSGHACNYLQSMQHHNHSEVEATSTCWAHRLLLCMFRHCCGRLPWMYRSSIASGS